MSEALLEHQRAEPIPTLLTERPVDERSHRVGAMDGLRAVAVAAVVVYHLSPKLLPSGYLGVDVFMVVSGFLITGLLLREHDRAGRIRLGAFWGRRFRRLMPALLLVLAAVALWVHIDGPRSLTPSIRAQGFAALGYFSNWKLIGDGVTYGGAQATASPLVHLWSLAVEEQFYVVWPLVVVGLLALSRGRRAPLIAVAALGTVASAVLMALLYAPGHDPIRAYYGTDTRAQAFLVGALAALIAPHLLTRGLSLARWGGALGLAGVLVAMRTDAPGVLYRGGFGLVAIGAAMAVLATTTRGPVATCLDRAPLRALGRVSYGVYLWHWPAITLLTPKRLGMTGLPVTMVRLAVTLGGALASWFLLERPLRRARPRRVALVAVPAIGIAALSLVALPATETLAYANFRTDRLPKNVVVVEPIASPTGPLPGGTGPLALSPTGTAMIVGDSGMYDATPALAAGLSASGWRVVEAAFPGAGLTQPAGVRDWWATQARRYHVDLTIVMLGRWDLGWAHAHGDAAFRALIDESVAGFTSAHGKVAWLSGLPGGFRSVPQLDAAYAQLPSRHPATVDYVSIDAALRGADGSFPRVVQGRLLRKPDGWHLCPDGAAALTHEVLGHLGLDARNWDAGAWRHDPRYNNPPGGCRAP
ncbi:MAG: oatA 3 [Actinomycetia bacterium]|nr:oatA 3 [Actinomycetes bacterium]